MGRRLRAAASGKAMMIAKHAMDRGTTRRKFATNDATSSGKAISGRGIDDARKPEWKHIFLSELTFAIRDQIPYSAKTACLIGEPPGSEAKLLAKWIVPLNVNDCTTAIM
jgi:hypothetical protein